MPASYENAFVANSWLFITLLFTSNSRAKLGSPSHAKILPNNLSSSLVKYQKPDEPELGNAASLNTITKVGIISLTVTTTSTSNQSAHFLNAQSSVLRN